MPETKSETKAPVVDEVAQLKAQLEEAQKVIDTLNKRLAKVVKLYNLMVDMYVQGDQQ